MSFPPSIIIYLYIDIDICASFLLGKKMQAAAASHHFPGVKQQEGGKGVAILVGHRDAATALACEDPPDVTRRSLSPAVSAAGNNTNSLD